MNKKTTGLSLKVQAVLDEIAAALERLLETGESWIIFVDKMALTPDDRQAIRDCLGQGSISIKLENTAEPAQWLESGVSGVWYGVFFDQTNNPILETIEVAFYPQVAGAQPEDMKCSLKELRDRLSTVGE